MRFALGLVLTTLLVIAIPARAGAAGTARLVYLKGHGTESCPDEQALRDAVAARLGYDAFTPWALDTLFTEIDKDGNAFVARVKLVTPESVVRGSRTLRTTGPCTDLVPTLGLTISLAIDPMALTRKGPPEGLPPTERPVESFETPPEAEKKAGTEPETSEASKHEAPSSPPFAFAAGAGLLGSVGSAPSPALGALLFGRMRRGDLSGTLEARADLPASDGTGGVGASSSLLLGTLLICVHNAGFFVCPKGSLGRFAAKGIDVTHPGESSKLWADVGARLGYELGLGGAFSLRLALDGVANLTRYSLDVAGTKVFENPVFGGGADAALVFTFQ